MTGHTTETEERPWTGFTEADRAAFFRGMRVELEGKTDYHEVKTIAYGLVDLLEREAARLSALETAVEEANAKVALAESWAASVGLGKKRQ